MSSEIAARSVAASTPAAAPAEDRERLESALDAIDPQSLRADLVFLADAELAGRDTPSTGLDVAARFLASRLERLGFQSSSGRAEDGFLVPWTLTRDQFDPEASGLTLTTRRGDRALVFGEDYFLARASHAVPLELEGDVVSVGEGRQADFEGTDLTGAWALVLDRGAATRRVQRLASAAGAVGVVLAETGSAKRSYRDRYTRTARSVFPAVDGAHDEPTADLLTQRMQVHEKNAWMLRSLLERA